MINGGLQIIDDENARFVLISVRSHIAQLHAVKFGQVENILNRYTEEIKKLKKEKRDLEKNIEVLSESMNRIDIYRKRMPTADDRLYENITQQMKQRAQSKRNFRDTARRKREDKRKKAEAEAQKKNRKRGGGVALGKRKQNQRLKKGNITIHI